MEPVRCGCWRTLSHGDVGPRRRKGGDVWQTKLVCQWGRVDWMVRNSSTRAESFLGQIFLMVSAKWLTTVHWFIIEYGSIPTAPWPPGFVGHKMDLRIASRSRSWLAWLREEGHAYSRWDRAGEQIVKEIEGIFKLDNTIEEGCQCCPVAYITLQCCLLDGTLFFFS